MFYDLLILIATMMTGLLGGLIFLMVFSRLIIALSAIPSAKEEAYSDYMNQALELNSRAIDIIYAIGKPDMSDGTYSPAKMKLWNRLHEIEIEQEALFQGMLQTQ
jgi:hypothetical protein